MSATATTPAATTTTPAATPAPGEAPKALPELDVVSLLLPGSKDAAAADKPKDEATGATDGAAADDADGAGAAAETDDAAAATETPATAEAPKPGTPDKALQKLQQDQAAALRKIEELSAKIEAGAKPTPADAAQLQAAKRKLDGIREGLKSKGADFDLLEHDKDIAESLVEHDDKLTATQAELADTKRRLAALEQRGAVDEATENWARNEAAYPKVDVKGVWNKALADAADLVGVDPAKLPADSPLHDAVYNAATKLFHGRAEAAAKSVKAKEPATTATAPKPAVTRTAADPTPNGGRVTGSNSNPPTGHVSEDTAYVNLAVGLVKT